jgi:hypothetical protein
MLFILGEKRLYPNGLIRVSRGSKTWTALVEVKTGPNQLATEQLENYLEIAREQGFDAVVTISNGHRPRPVLDGILRGQVSWTTHSAAIRSFANVRRSPRLCSC